MNELDRAMLAVQRSRASTPEFYRQLATGELWFLLPFHPEMEGAHFEIKNGTTLPFVMLMDAAGEIVPLFSSEARLEEGLKAGRVPANTYLCGKMPAEQVLEILGKVELRAVLNKGCATGQIVLPPDLMRDLADGSAFKPQLEAETKQGELIVIDPADYPTDLIQPVFEFIRQQASFCAAWVFETPPRATQSEPGHCYQLLFLMTPRDEIVFHDLNLVVQATRVKGVAVELGLLNESNTTHIKYLFRKAPPFYTAANYDRPSET